MKSLRAAIDHVSYISNAPVGLAFVLCACSVASSMTGTHDKVTGKQDIRRAASRTVAITALAQTEKPTAKKMEGGENLKARIKADFRSLPIPVNPKGKADVGLTTAYARSAVPTAVTKCVAAVADSDIDKRSIAARAHFARPLHGPIIIKSPFAFRRFHPVLGIWRPHTGDDLHADYGTPIFAAFNGTVEEADFKGGYGRYVKLLHKGSVENPRRETGYGHMSRFVGGLHAGAHVKKGQLIGWVGQSGTATGPHLHYEVFIDGVAVDPTPFLSQGIKMTQSCPALEALAAVAGEIGKRQVSAGRPATTSTSDAIKALIASGWRRLAEVRLGS